MNKVQFHRLHNPRNISMFMYCFLIFIMFSSHALEQDKNADDKNSKPNILVFMIDDLRPDLGSYGHAHAITPNIDKLANQGVSFNRAYAQQAICGPSRVSIMTGLRPETTGLYTIRRDGRLRPNQPNVVSLPQLFKANGYKTISIGKVYHSTTDDQENWSTHIKKLPNFYVDPEKQAVRYAYEAGNVEDDFYKDGKVARDADIALREHQNDPFLMFVGFSKPHLPFNAPKKYWDMYQRDQFTVPSRKTPDNMFRLALTKWNELRMYGGIPKEGYTDDELTKTLIHAYYATVSYMDAQVGKVLNTLDELGLRENTTVIFMSDHGYKLGEYGAWNKHTNMELDTRVPLIISQALEEPKRKSGVTSDALVEYVDIFPTIAETAGLPLPVLDGVSLKPLLEQPQIQLKQAAFSIFNRGRIMGVSVTDGFWRYTEWRDANSQAIKFVELYDHRDSQVVSENVAKQPQYEKVEIRLRNMLQQQFPLDGPSFYAPRNVINNTVSIKADLSNKDAHVGEMFDFFNVAVRTERGNPKSKPATYGRTPKVTTVRMLGGWYNQDLSGDTYRWDGKQYVYNFKAATQRIDRWLANDWDIFQIVLDNPPWAFQRGIKFVDKPDGKNYLSKDRVGVYGNGIPPNDAKAWSQYIVAFMEHLIDTYSKETVLQWRFRIGSEIDTRPQHWAGTREEFFAHYQNTVEAVKSVLPDAVVGAHFREASHKSKYIDYTGQSEDAYAPSFVNWAKKHNVPYDFLAISYYPHITHPHEMDMENVYTQQIAPIVEHPDYNQNASFEIHEFKFIVKMERAGFVSVGTSHNSAFFAMLSKMALQKNIRQIFQWGNAHGGYYNGEAMTQFALHGMLGSRIYTNTVTGSPLILDNNIDAIVTQHPDNHAIDVLAYNFNNKNLTYQSPESLSLSLNVKQAVGTSYQYRVAQLDRASNIEQVFTAESPKATIPVSAGGWLLPNTHPTAALNKRLNSQGLKQFNVFRSGFERKNQLVWSEWVDAETLPNKQSGSKIKINRVIPSFSVQKYEIKWLQAADL